MSDVIPNRGQIYYARTRGELADRCIEQCGWHVLAMRRDDVEPRLRYTLDLSRYSRFEIVLVERIGQVRRVSHRLFPNEHLAAADMALEVEAPESDEAAIALDRPVLVQRTFSVEVAGSLPATNLKQVLRTVGSYLLRWGLDEPSYRNPFINGGTVDIREQKP